ncbi:uncharacterized protein [Miscanthus floridulus]|uniref:uncharacterized protein n=1 Tax=Miscanthus floridulus TaxID=154761 RepID=UPI00345ABB94
MSDELKQVGRGFSRRVKSFTVYDVNGYRFRTRSYEESRPNLKTMCCGVRTPGTDGKDYYGIVEEIYELNFKGAGTLAPVVFKCHWFDPDITRKDLTIGQVEIRQDSSYKGDDVYIVANRDATQVYYLPWACQKDEKLAGWSLVHLVSPRGKAPLPNDDDYNFDPSTDEFYQPEGLEGTLEIDIGSLMGMEVDNEIDEDEGEEVQDARDLRMLERWQMQRDGVVQEEVHDDDYGDDEDDDDSDDLRELDNIDSDDDDSDRDDDSTPEILPFAEIITRPCTRQNARRTAAAAASSSTLGVPGPPAGDRRRRGGGGGGVGARVVQ